MALSHDQHSSAMHHGSTCRVPLCSYKGVFLFSVGDDNCMESFPRHGSLTRHALEHCCVAWNHVSLFVTSKQCLEQNRCSNIGPHKGALSDMSHDYVSSLCLTVLSYHTAMVLCSRSIIRMRHGVSHACFEPTNDTVRGEKQRESSSFACKLTASPADDPAVCSKSAS
jgi:hypothetical protein